MSGPIPPSSVSARVAEDEVTRHVPIDAMTKWTMIAPQDGDRRRRRCPTASRRSRSIVRTRPSFGADVVGRAARSRRAPAPVDGRSRDAEGDEQQDQAHRPEGVVPRLARDGVAHVQGDLAGQGRHRLGQRGRASIGRLPMTIWTARASPAARVMPSTTAVSDAGRPRTGSGRDGSSASASCPAPASRCAGPGGSPDRVVGDRS